MEYAQRREMTPMLTRTTPRHPGWRCGVVAVALLSVACTVPAEEIWEPELGLLDDTLDPAARTVWPGRDTAEGARVIPLINAFFEDTLVSYWFVGLAPPTTADMYWFCRDGDNGCPLGADGRLALDRTVGAPVFARMPGEQSYSTYWWIKVIRVPDSYQPNAIKSVNGIEKALRGELVHQEWFLFDYGGQVGPKRAIEHSVLVLEGTILEANGADLLAQPGVGSERIPLLQGWHKQYRVHFYDFTAVEGILAPDSFDGAPVVVPAGSLYMLFRDCSVAAGASACAATNEMRGAVDERALGHDLTTDGDLADTNNILGARAVGSSLDATPNRGWGLWAVYEATVVPGQSDPVALIDTNGDQRLSAITNLATLSEMVDAGRLSPPEPLSTARLHGPIPPSRGDILFDCPLQVAASSLSSLPRRTDAHTVSD